MKRAIFYAIFIILVLVASTLFALNTISSVEWMLSVFCLVIVAIIFTSMTKKRT
ncbi:hypothetical protein [Listeria welshimeri]|uniref:hypothetical protein n=1 Tax=Listeria welshimeri TaxID=1643 RepID=UPI0016243FD0|nr:hypothetical protein [Listeria welshimeri]MBC1477205.1 hypothetical protein [Listeria welshimeri]MBC1980520.1 hypothetical protein [Listeria welshimeri]MBC2042151.1 hypothetical protein [Listeria welshimeri]MBF2341050.1 hypothetical protein [Listeria welshimeri]MBF2352342.1 hypothetical protein [Listeria welshimeri]